MTSATSFGNLNLIMEGKMLEMFEVGPCEDGFQLGFLIGQRFRNQIRSRLAGDHILQNQLLPFAQTSQAQQLIKALSETNQNKFPRYWAELLRIAEGSAVPVLDVVMTHGKLLISSLYCSIICGICHILLLHVQIILINFRKELVPFISNAEMNSNANTADDCSDVLIVSDSMAIAAHNEDAVLGLIGNTYALVSCILFRF
ncbi:hypothetical protein V6N13_096249 [Hibiscus sabdariffa]|uniref:Uncharacterized protein n=2 Tax=Hibiscus sabdariffa TaxID=183260 RepID=A0ABR2DG95_9ROSI